MIYFDNAATTMRKPDCVIDAVADAMRNFGNSGRGAHEASLDASRMIYETRERISELFNLGNPLQVAFTSNSTESLNMAIQGLFSKGDHVITTVLEHNSVLRPLYLMENRGVSLTILPCDEKGVLCYDQLEESIRPETKAVVCTHASNLTGNRMDLERVGELCHRHGIRLVADASQTAGVLPIDMKRMHIDVLCFTGHKSLLGPQGIGALLLDADFARRLTPLVAGGTGSASDSEELPDWMPDRFESGTPNMPGVYGWEAALGWLENTGIETLENHEKTLSKRFLEGIYGLKNVKLYGATVPEGRTGVFSVGFLNCDNAEAAWRLEREFGILTRCGLHCAPSAHKTLGSFPEGSVRFSTGWANTEADIDAALSAIAAI